MTTLPVVLLQMATVGVGLILGLRFLRGQPRKPTLIGLHFLLAAAGLEGVMLLLHGAPNGDRVDSGPSGTLVLGLFVVALLSGLAAATLGRQSPQRTTKLVATHAGLAALGFLTFLVWVAKQ